VGTRAVEDPEWIASTAALYPGSVIVASDVRGGRPAIRGWAADSSESLDDLLARLSPLPLAGILVTAVDVEGRMQGPDIGLMERVLALTSLPLIASGGITTMQDMEALRELGVSAAVLGMSLYQGALDAPLVAREFST
jgi:phosphoribosylformimino-5-aminoimidazole carboxamide ribonucleotide (ProFAR) isomerase